MTQLEMARQGIISTQMEEVARYEGLEAEHQPQEPYPQGHRPGVDYQG